MRSSVSSLGTYRPCRERIAKIRRYPQIAEQALETGMPQQQGGARPFDGGQFRPGYGPQGRDRLDLVAQHLFVWVTRS